MLSVDLYVPFMSPFKNFIRVPDAVNISRYQFWYPIWLFKNKIKEMGVKVRFINSFDFKYRKISKIIGLDRTAEYLRINFKEISIKLKKENHYIIYFDQCDGTSRPFFNIIPYVDRYFNRQLLKDRSLYNKKKVCNSVFNDFYYNNYNIKTNEKPYYQALDSTYEDKIGLSWNYAYGDYRHFNNFQAYMYGLTKKNSLKYIKPNSKRNYLFSANFSIHRNLDIFYFQRIKLLEFLKKKYSSYKNVSLGHVPQKLYKQNLMASKAVFSPFGYGEPCFRDSEAFIAGTALIKPDMDHLETWPNIYQKNKTYLSIPWRIEDWEESIPEILSDEDRLLEIAKNGHNFYKRLWSKEGIEEFCNRFINMVTPPS